MVRKQQFGDCKVESGDMARNGGTEPFSRTSDGWRRLTEMWDEGTASADMPPRSIYGSDPVFLRYSKDQFRAGLNRFKAERGEYVRPRRAATAAPPEGGIDFNAQRALNAGIAQLQGSRAASAAAAPAPPEPPSQRTPIVTPTVKNPPMAMSTAAVKQPPPEDSKIPALPTSSQMVTNFNVAQEDLSGYIPKWEPCFTKCSFKDDELRNRQGVIVLLPSGVTDPEQVLAKVEPSGDYLSIKFMVPSLFGDPNLFLMFADLDEYASSMKDSQSLRINGWHEAMKQERASIGYQQWREFRLQLDYTVQEDILMLHFLNLGPCYYVYLELHGKEKDSYLDYNGRLNVKVTNLSHVAKMRGLFE